MNACPYCGEDIQAEARLCKHCQRSVLYSLVLTGSLEEKQKHELIKIWPTLTGQNFKRAMLGNYAQAKTQLEQVPFTLAWDMSSGEAKDALQKFSKIQTLEMKLQGGLPSNFSAHTEEAQGIHWNSLVFGLTGLVLISVAIFFGLRKSQEEIRAPVALSSLQTFENAVPNFQMPVAPSAPSSTNLEGFSRVQMQALLSATVFITDNASLGSGFFITSDGYILSNAHVTSDMETPIVILNDGRRFESKKVKQDSRYDISLLKVDISHAPFLKLGDANQLYAGQSIVTIGNPGGLSFTVTRGIVSYLGRMVNGIPHIQTDAAINRGNSGGPMINENLEVVGINTLTSLKDQGISFSLPINLACDHEGVTAGISTSPSECPSFNSTLDPLAQTSFESNRPSKNSPQGLAAEYYQSEANSLKAALDADEAELKSEYEDLKKRADDLKAQMAKDPSNGSLKERVTAQLNELTEKSKGFNKRQAQMRVRYFKQMVDLLQRQRGDPLYDSVVGQIDQQIQQFQKYQQETEASLN